MHNTPATTYDVRRLRPGQVIAPKYPTRAQRRAPLQKNRGIKFQGPGLPPSNPVLLQGPIQRMGAEEKQIHNANRFYAAQDKRTRKAAKKAAQLAK